MKLNKLVAATAVMYFFLGVFSYALAEYNFTISPTSDGTTAITQTNRGEEIIVNLILDNPVGVAGCAFTLEFDSSVFTPPETDENGVPVNDGDIISAFPFSFQTNEIDLTQTHRENSSVDGMIYFSGAAIDTATGGSLYTTAGDVALFTFKMKVNKDAAIGNTTLTLKQTELWNLDAGYGTDVGGDGSYDEGTDTMGTVAVLVGALDSSDANFDDLTQAFPELLDNPAGALDTLVLPVGACIDADSDGLCDYVETGTGIFVDENDTGTYKNNADSDNDGLTDGEEVNTTNTNPVDDDSDNDGFTDGEEDGYDTNPNDDTDYPLLVSITGPDTLQKDDSDNFVLTANVPEGKTLTDYQITITYDQTKIGFVSSQANDYPFPPDTVNTDTPGTIVISGTGGSVLGAGPGPQPVSLVELTFSGDDTGDLTLDITVDTFDVGVDPYVVVDVDHPLEVLTCQPGDANMDGAVNMADALMIAEYSVFILTEGEVPGFACCDTNCDGSVNMADALRVAEFSVFIIPNLNCE